MRVINDHRQNFRVSLVLRTTVLSNFKKMEKAQLVRQFDDLLYCLNNNC